MRSCQREPSWLQDAAARLMAGRARSCSGASSTPWVRPCATASDRVMLALVISAWVRVMRTRLAGLGSWASVRCAWMSHRARAHGMRSWILG